MPKSFDDGKNENISKHILPTSSNLLGLCFILINFLKFLKLSKKVDLALEIFVGMAITLFLVASVLSYMSMRSKKKGVYYEKIADIFFLTGLLFITALSLLVVFEVF